VQADAGCFTPRRREGLKFVKPLFWLSAFLIATVLTQIGGVAVILAWLLLRRRSEGNFAFRANRVIGALFGSVLLYIALTNFVVPSLALRNGRVALSCTETSGVPVRAAHPLYCWLNRNYVDPKLRDLLFDLAKEMDRTHPGTVTIFLDANFPFFNGFPLLPHLSHDDGRKLDIAFYYADRAGTYLRGETRSPIGYWGFEQPREGDASPCATETWLTLRWNMSSLQPYLQQIQLDEVRTSAALRWLVQSDPKYGMERILLEPYLATRLGVASPLIRFQGCRAARHDDHIHIQIAR
jgi:hypothetical protein